MDNMTAGQELLRQKEDRLKVMENALLGGGLVRNFSLFVIISFIRSNFNSRLLHICQLSWIRHWSPALPYLPDKIDFWAFLCFSLKFSSFFLKIRTFLFIVRFLGHFWTYLVTDKDCFVITMMKANFDSSCKTSCNVLSHSRIIIWWLV